MKVLQAMNPQHAFQTHWWAAGAFGLRVKRFDDLAQATPGNDLFHLIQKLVPLGRFAVAFKTFIRERLLADLTCLRVT